ncbi:MAG TPA: PD-(D/E)XK nuclease family protein [Pirellulales bacterium]|nr:PD-(D/E)XK nuclease family protein [Pirellulales bacterium]
MPIAREMLDWSQPALPQAVGWLAQNYARSGRFDLRTLVVALPGAEAGRRLLELLVAESHERGWLFTPPRIVTPGHLPELLYPKQKLLAGELVQQLAWLQVLRATEAERLKPLVHQPPLSDDLPAWIALARMLAQLHHELAADGLDCTTILQHGRELDSFNEAERWQLLAELQQGYLRALDALELWDEQTARRVAIEKHECSIEGRIVLVGVVDLNRSQRQMLEQVADRVTTLVFAPRDHAARFDEYGCVVAERWQGVAMGLNLEQIEIANGPGDQADAVVRTLHGWNRRFAADEITIGVPDPSLVPYLRQRLDEAGLPARHGAGMPIERSGPYQLLGEVADFLERRRFRDLAVLVRHPALARWLARSGVDRDWLTPLDNYYADHLPAELDRKALASHRAAKEVRLVQGRVQGLLSSFAGPAEPLDEWPAVVLELLSTIYGGEVLDDTVAADRAIIRACDAIRVVLVEYQQVPSSLAPAVTGAAALRLLLSQLSGGSIPPAADAAAIELSGWLELPWDDAAALIVTGVNEGIVPKSRRGDMFLPDALRRRLNLEDNARRYARDAYALSLLAALERPLKIIVGRRSAEGDPLVPSRLLLACPDEELAHRTRRLLAAPPSRQRILLPGSLRPGQSGGSRLPIPPPQPLAEPIVALRVTELRDYLACPYRYYLRRRLNLHALDDWAEELNAASFGNVLHAVLKDFSRGSAADSTSPDAIRDWLFGTLGRLKAESFGDSSLPAVKLQIEMLRLRLEKFAELQARHRSEGWKIVEVEKEFAAGEVMFPADDGPISLIGRIDRIDRNERTGEVAVLDYKSSDSAKSPDKVHRQGRAPEKEWIDFQLPLYRYLVRSLELPEPVRLGYVILPKDIDRSAIEFATWTPEELEAADAAARAAVRGIRAGQFWPPADPPPSSFAEFAAICQDDQFVAAALSAEAGEDSP